MSLPTLETFKANPLGSTTTIEDVIDAFEFLDDWEERYGYIIDLGKSLPEFPDSQRVEENYVHGCQSQVWLIHHYDAESNKLYLMIDSDAIIVKGLAAIVLATLNAKTPQDILSMDVEASFEKIDLMRHISPSRGNGLRAMLELIKQAAEKYQ
ncbi:Fe-S metabolism protein SufE [Oleiphilus sp. HI0118]|nr:Fe-S metabolism protein SufE [Oleiphilus sp. HI0118]